MRFTSPSPPGEGEPSASGRLVRTVHRPALTLAVWRGDGYIGSGEAVSRVRSHISPGPYRSFRELSLAGSVDPVIWCPPTFVGNSGIARSNGHRGFALLFACLVAYRVFTERQSSASRPVRRSFSMITTASGILDRPGQAGR